MALQLQTELPNGIVADYFKIIEMKYNNMLKQSHVILALYLNQEARLNGKEPIKVEVFNFDGEIYPFEVEAMASANPYQIAYAKLKTLDEFSNSIDC